MSLYEKIVYVTILLCVLFTLIHWGETKRKIINEYREIQRQTKNQRPLSLPEHFLFMICFLGMGIGVHVAMQEAQVPLWKLIFPDIFIVVGFCFLFSFVKKIRYLKKINFSDYWQHLKNRYWLFNLLSFGMIAAGLLIFNLAHIERFQCFRSKGICQIQELKLMPPKYVTINEFSIQNIWKADIESKKFSRYDSARHRNIEDTMYSLNIYFHDSSASVPVFLGASGDFKEGVFARQKEINNYLSSTTESLYISGDYVVLIFGGLFFLIGVVFLFL